MLAKVSSILSNLIVSTVLSFFLGDVFEKAGVNISVVWGTMNPEQVKTMRSRGKNIEEGNSNFFATGR